MEVLTQDLVIIGAGVSGLSAALALLQRGYGVTVLERGQVGRESSWAGAGILSPLLPWDYAPAVSEFALRSMAMYPAWIAGIETVSGMATEYWRCGMQLIDYSDVAQAQAWCNQHALACNLDGIELRLADIAQVRGPRLLAALHRAVVALGGRVIEHAEVVELRRDAGRATAVLTRDAAYATDLVVLASGAWAGIGLGALQAVPGIVPVRGQILLYKLAPGILQTILYRNGVYLIPRRDGHVLAGSTLEHVGFDRTTTAAAQASLHAAASAMLPALSGLQPLRHWAGLRPGAPDNIPLIDRHPDAANVWVNAGHFRYGVTMAPASADLLADLIEGRTPVLDAQPYSWASALTRSWVKSSS
jgi:glycine oxidase